MRKDKIVLGTCYYPEHWDKSLWEDDLKRMLQDGIEQIRIAEFAWNKFEPEEGVFDFSFFDEFMDLAKRVGMKVIFCTPTATAPLWLTEKYPETLNADVTGNLFYHGMRQQTNLTSETYRRFSGRITQKLIEHYRKYENIIGWQLDNEINCGINIYYSEADHQAFRKYCKDKYQTLDNFNEKMGTVFWNQTYTDWEQVHLSRLTVNGSMNNPHLALEEKRFISAMVFEFFKLQADIIRPGLREDQFITTNGIFGHVDYQSMIGPIFDFITFDSYPNFAFSHDQEKKPEDPARDENNTFFDRNSSFNMIKTRGISNRFGIMEQQSGPGGWVGRMPQPSPKPGQMRLWTMQSIAHGADFVSYFRWRTCSIGTEIYWHGLLNYDNRDNRRIEELRRIHQELEKIGTVAGKDYKAEVAILRDYDNEWDGEEDIWHGPLNELSTDAWFQTLQNQHIPFDFKDLRDDTKLKELQKYQFLIYPHPTILTKERAEVLTAYVENGGQIVFGARTGYKDHYGRCPMQAMPGLVADLCGVIVTDFTFTNPQDEVPVIGLVGQGKENVHFTAPKFNDILEPQEGTEVLGVFQNEYYRNQPALTCRQRGKGKAFYLGAGFTKESAQAILQIAQIGSPFDSIIQVPAEVELAVREGAGGAYLFVLNYKNEEKKIVIKQDLQELLSEKVMTGEVTMQPFDVYCLKIK